MLRYSIDSGLVENAGAYWLARSLIFFPIAMCINGDTIVDVHFQHLLQAHMAMGAVATLVGSTRDNQPHTGAIEVSLDGWVRAIHEDEQDRGKIIKRSAICSYYSNSGVYVFDRERIEEVWPKRFRVGKLEQGLLKYLASKHMLWAYDNGTKFLLDIGVPKRLAEAKKQLIHISKFFPL